MNYDPFITCPNDKSHQILRSRMPMHLSRCNRNFPNSKKKHCPYDASHMVEESEYNSHMSTCPAREAVLHYQMREKELEPSLVKIEPHDMNTLGSWETDDCNQVGYDPLQNINDRLVVRSFPLCTKSEKRKLRNAERLRFQRLEEQNKLESEKMNQNKNNTKTGTKPKVRTIKTNEQLEGDGEEAAGYHNVLQYPTDKEASDLPLRRPHDCQPSKFLLYKNICKDTSNTCTLQSKSEQNVEQIKNAMHLNNNSFQQSSQCQGNNIDPSPKKLFSYAAALHKKKEQSTRNTLNDAGAERITNKSLATCIKLNENIIDKLSKTVKEIAIEDEGYQKKTEPLNKKIDLLKKSTTEKNSTSNSRSNENTEKKSRCAAKFSNNI